MGNSLEHLLAEGVISEILSRLKSGKEADVYAVRQGGKVIAAKVYKDHGQRSFKNNAVYQEGRQVRNSRSQRAMDRGSRFGKEAAEEAWKSAEANTLYKLHAAGVRVPTPVMFLEGVLFMELVLGSNGYAAPRLIDTQLSPDEANMAYRDMLTQLVRILCCDLIHGDLSPYNVLWAATGPTIIDFPQSVSASHNNSSERFFLRDARNILGHFADIDPRLASRSGDAAEIWRAYVRRELGPDFVPSGRPARPDARPPARPDARPPARPDARPRFEPNQPRAAGHRGPPQHSAKPEQRGSSGGANKPFSSGQRPQSAPGQRPQSAPGQRPQAAPGQRPQSAPGQRPQAGQRPQSAPNHARGPRRPEVIVLRRSPKSATGTPAGSPSGESELGSPPSAEPRFQSARSVPHPGHSQPARPHPAQPQAPHSAQGSNSGAGTGDNAPTERKRRRRRRPRTSEHS